jgi:hypothetical protein
MDLKKNLSVLLVAIFLINNFVFPVEQVSIVKNNIGITKNVVSALPSIYENSKNMLNPANFIINIDLDKTKIFNTIKILFMHSSRYLFPRIFSNRNTNNVNELKHKLDEIFLNLNNNIIINFGDVGISKTKFEIYLKKMCFVCVLLNFENTTNISNMYFVENYKYLHRPRDEVILGIDQYNIKYAIRKAECSIKLYSAFFIVK